MRISRIFFPSKAKIKIRNPDERSFAFAGKKKNLNKKSDYGYRTGRFGFSSTPRPKCAACKNTVDVCFCPGDLPSAISTPMNNKSTLPHYERASLHFLQPRDPIESPWFRITILILRKWIFSFFFFFSPRNRDGGRGNTRRWSLPFFLFLLFFFFLWIVRRSISYAWLSIRIFRNCDENWKILKV